MASFQFPRQDVCRAIAEVLEIPDDIVVWETDPEPYLGPRSNEAPGLFRLSVVSRIASEPMVDRTYLPPPEDRVVTQQSVVTSMDLQLRIESHDRHTSPDDWGALLCLRKYYLGELLCACGVALNDISGTRDVGIIEIQNREVWVGVVELSVNWAASEILPECREPGFIQRITSESDPAPAIFPLGDLPLEGDIDA